MRPLLSKGDIIQVNNTKYCVEECIGSGNQAAVYRCAEPGNDRKTCCVKEFIPSWVERRSRSTQSDYKPIIIPRDRRDEWLRLKESVKHSEALVRGFADESIQAHYLTEESDFKRMTFKMPKVASSCQKLSDLWELWKTHPPKETGDDSELPRIKKSTEIVLSLAKAIKDLHSHQLIHGDLTPTNVFYSGEHTVAFPIDFACCSKIGYPSEDFTFHSPGYSHPLRKDASVHIDLYSLAALFIAMGTGGYCMANSKTLKVKDLTVFENIHDSVSRIAVPNGVKAKFEVIVANAAEASNTPYTSATQLVDDLEILLEIIDRRGMHPEVLFDASAKEFKKQCDNENGIFHYELQDDLVTDAVDFDSKTPVDILTQNTILLGSGGSGKTTKIRKLWEQCLSDWKTDRKNNPIPVYVPLNTFNSSKDGKDFIKTYIATQYFRELSKDDGTRYADLMGMLTSRGRYILFLDGINEAVGNDKLNAEIADFAAIENVTVLITSRNDWGDAETKKLFSTAELMPLNDDLILRKLQENNLNSPSARLLETLQRPMFLALYLRIKITDNAVETPGQILFAHHKHLISSYKTGHHGSDTEERFKLVVDYILPRLATEINSLQFDYNKLYDAAEVIYADAVVHNRRFKKLKSNENEMDIADLVENVLHECGILQKLPAINNYVPGIYVFSHQNYLEFYQALDVYNQMAAFKEGKDLPDALSAGILPDAVMHFLGDLLGEHIIQTNRNRNTPTIEEWLQSNCTNRGDYPAQIVIRNLIETMKISTGKQLQKRCFKNLDLTLANFYDCDLHGSDFSCAKIGDATFIRQGHDNPIDELLVIPEKNWILSSSSKENYIYIWDINTGSQVGFIGGDNSPLSSPVLSLDKKTIIVSRGFDIALYNLESNRIIHDFAVDYADLYADLEKYLEELCDEFFDKTQNYKWLSSDSKEVYFTTRGSTRLGVHSIRGNILAKILNNSGDEFFSFDYPIRCCTMSADSKKLYLVLSNGQLLVWDTAQKTCLAEQTRAVPRNTDSIFLDSGEAIALIHTESNELHVIDLRTGSAYNISTEMSMAEAGDKMLFASTQHYFLWHDGTTLFSIDIDGCQFISILLPGVTCMCLDHENDRAFLSFDDGKIKIVDAKTLRVLSAFDCGEQNNWAEPHRFCPHWYDEGLARITKHKRIQCLTPEGFKTIPVDKTTCNYFEGNYHFCLTKEPEDLFMLVIDLHTGCIVEKIPFNSLCLSNNSKGEEIFRGHSGFCWAKYFPQKGKVIVNYTVGLIKIWDIDKKKWYSVGCWNQEIEHMQSLYDFFEQDDWDMIEEHLFDISSRNHVFGNHIVQGTYDGMLLWWDFNGNLCKADHPHRHNTKIYAFPDSAYFVTEGLDYVRCVWNWETMELIETTERKRGASRGNVLKVLPKQNTLPVLRDEHEELRFWYEYLDQTVLVCYEKGGYNDLKNICCNQDIVVYTTNHYICVCGLYDDKCDNEYLLRTFKTLLAEDADSWVNYSLNGDLLAVAFADGTLKIFDIRKNPEKHIRLEWSATSTTDVSECKFTRATVNGWIEYPLIMNGAYFDNEDARRSIEKNPVVRLLEQKEILREEIANDPYDAEKWIRFFSDFGSNMSGKEFRHHIHDLQENFDDAGMRRAVFGNTIDDIYSDEENMLNNIPKTIDGLQTLCRYLSKHLECEYGFNMLFNDFESVLDADTRDSMKELLLATFDLDFLRWTYPHEFGFPDLDDEDMYDKNCLLHNDETL